MTDEEDSAELRQLVRDVIDRVSPPARSRELDAAREFDRDLYDALAAAGLVQLEADGASHGALRRSQAVVLEELGASATSMAVAFVVQYMGVRLLSQHATDRQRDTILAPLLSGEARVAFALSEAGGGTDVLRAMTTRAVEDPDGWVLDGEKSWISGATTSDHLVVVARTESGGDDAASGTTMFIVPRDAPGVVVSELETMAIHGLSTCIVSFDRVRVARGDVLGRVGSGFRQLLDTLNDERVNAAAVAAGIARGALDSAVAYASERRAFGREIGAFQALQHRLVDAAIAVEAARALLDAAVACADAGADYAVASAMAKVAASEAAITATDTGMRVLASMGVSTEHPMERFFRDARLYTFAPVSNEMARNFIAERRLGLPRSY